MEFLAFIPLDIYKKRVTSTVNDLQCNQMQSLAFHFVPGACFILSLKFIAFYYVGVFLFLNWISLVIAKARLFVMVWAKYSAVRWYAGFPKEL